MQGRCAQPEDSQMLAQGPRGAAPPLCRPRCCEQEAGQRDCGQLAGARLAAEHLQQPSCTAVTPKHPKIPSHQHSCKDNANLICGRSCGDPQGRSHPPLPQPPPPSRPSPLPVSGRPRRPEPGPEAGQQRPARHAAAPPAAQTLPGRRGRQMAGGRRGAGRGRCGSCQLRRPGAEGKRRQAPLPAAVPPGFCFFLSLCPRFASPLWCLCAPGWVYVAEIWRSPP